MRKKRLQEVSEVLVRNHRRRSWRRRVGALACAVAVATSSLLIHPAMTLEKAAKCGLTEHTHTEACYDSLAEAGKSVPVCTPESLGLHQHTEACRNENGDLICGYSDFVVHQHDASCYGEDGTLWCSLPEIEVHIHDENCYSDPKTDSVSAHTHTEACYGQKRGDLICGYATEGHVHTDECYEEKETLVCPVLEGHKHDESCFDGNGVMVCGVEEDNGHIHGAECYETTRELVCAYGETAHQHTDECYTWIMEPVCGFSAESAQPELICGKEEVLLHEHTDTCFDADGNVICGQTQVLKHVHTDDCFQAVEEAADAKTLICEMEEHIHTQECFADQTVDLESSDTQGESEPVDTSTESEPAGAESGPADAPGEIGYDSAAEESGSADVPGESAGAPEFTMVRMAADGVAHWVMGAEGTDHSWQTLDAQEIIRIEDGSGNTAKIMPLTAGKVFLVHNYKVGDELHMETFEVDVLEMAEEPETKAETAEKPETERETETEPETETETETETESEVKTETGTETEVETETEPETETEAETEIETETETEDMIEETGEAAETEEESGTETETEAETDSVIEYTQSVAELAGLAGRLSPAGIAGNLASLANRNQSAASAISVPAASDPSLAHRRMIDAFGDGVDNPDTTVDDNTAEDHSNLYRQYLDVTGAAEPMDVLFVVDCSDDAVAVDGTANDGTAVGGTADGGAAAGGTANDGTAADGQTARLEAAEAYLKGEDGLAARILAQNAENRIAVCAINGKAAGEESPAQLPAGITNPAAASNPAAAEPTVLPNVGMAQGLIALPNGVASPDAAAPEPAATAEPTTSIGSVTAPEPEASPDAAALEPEALPKSVAVTDPTTSSEPADSPGSEASANQDAAQNSGTSSDPVAEDPAAVPKPAVSQEPAAAEDSAAIQGQAEAEKPAAPTGATAAAGGTILVDWTGEGLPEELSLAAAKEEREQTSDSSVVIGRAEELFLADEVKENGHRKVVVFLDSDTLVDDLGTDRVNNVSYFDAAADDKESLTTWLQELSMPKAVSITDRLSVYTELCDEQTDYKVTMEDADSVATVLYENGAVTDAGNGILKEVVFNEETRTVSALFCEDYRLQPEYRYTLSFNTTVSGQAYEEYYESGYPSQGDAETDYVENQTSAGQMGFYVDDEACVSYQVGGVSYSEIYDKPVMQFAEMAMVMSTDTVDTTMISGIGADFSDLTLEHDKMIDAFRDGDDNPDTTLDDTLDTLDKAEQEESNLHRLYLDVTAPDEKKPMDLLLVLDNSSSMFVLDTAGNRLPNRNAYDRWNEYSKSRNTAMNGVLEKFIPEFLGACEGNRIRIVYFSGPDFSWSADGNISAEKIEDLDKSTILNNPKLTLTSSEKQVVNQIRDVGEDAWIQCDWVDEDGWKSLPNSQKLLTTDKNVKDGEKDQKGAGTNYEAGLNEAGKVLREVDPKRNAVMMFVSDGVPTHFIYDDGTRGGNGLSSENATAEPAITNGTNNETRCNQPVLNAIKSFQNNYPNLPIYSVSFCTKKKDEKDFDYALEAMPRNGGSYNRADTPEELEAALRTLLTPVSNISIKDELSAYVDLYTTQPDYKVTKQRVNVNGDDTTTTETVVLYENGAFTEEGKKALKSVGPDANDSSGKTVSAVFNDNYELEEGWTYTLSFNVIASQYAHDEYEKNGKDAYAATTGDPGTDYAGNATSSENPGFHSNKSAKLTYKVMGEKTPREDDYPHPVIQVKNTEVTVQKKWFDGDTEVKKTDGSITFDLIQTGCEVKSKEAPGNVDVDVSYNGYYGQLGKRQVQDGSRVTITVTPNGWGNFSGLSINGTEIRVGQLQKSDSQYSYTFTVSGATNIRILANRTPDAWNVIPLEELTSGVTFEPVGEPVKYDSGTIGNDEGWQKVFSNLPASGTVDGKDVLYTYKVTEASVEGYETTYENNDGVTGGTIIIKNTTGSGGGSGGGSTTDIPSLDHHKRIDAFRDGVKNPDTDLDNTAKDKTDLYRLYLDITGKTEPMDVLFVVDRSYSMKEEDLTIDGNKMRRMNATINFLTGKDGFVNYILEQNDENRIAVCSFDGIAENDVFGETNNDRYTYITDSKVRQEWTSDLPDQIDFEVPNDRDWLSYRTNYCAGLRRANDLFNKVNGHKKVMIFLSDGVPTYYLDMNTKTRRGNGNYRSEPNVKDCVIGAKATFDWFYGLHKDVTVYTIGLSKDLAGSDYSHNPEVLQYMASKSGGKFIGVQEDMKKLREELEAVFMPGNVTITDTLSEYVDVYTEHPDYKVIMEKEDGTEKTLLYESNNAAAEGDTTGVKRPDIVKSVAYDSTTKTVTAQFEENYRLRPGYRYYLSFNVKATPKAYEDYAENRRNDPNPDGYGYAGTTGDADTDYTGNSTSSNQPGFHSNDKATVSYTIDKTRKTEPYEHPVIQVSNCDLTVNKQWFTAAGSSFTPTEVHQSIQFNLMQIATPINSGGGTATGGGQDTTTQDPPYGTYTIEMKSGWTTTIAHLPLKGRKDGQEVKYSYKVEEIPIEGYETTYESDYNPTDTYVPTYGENGSVANGEITIKNTVKPSYELPATGGSGTTTLYTIGGLLTGFAGLLLLYNDKKRRKEGFAS